MRNVPGTAKMTLQKARASADLDPVGFTSWTTEALAMGHGSTTNQLFKTGD